MSKRLRNLALLGGLGAAAYMMGRKKDDSKESKESKEDMERDAREEAISGPLKETKSDKASKAIGRSMMDGDKTDTKSAPTKPRKAAADTPTARAPTRDEGRTASGMPREARGVAGSGDTGTETEAEYRARMEQLQKDQGLKAVRPEEYLGPIKALRGLHNLAKMGRGSAAEGATTGREVAETAAQARFLGRGPRQEMPARLSNQPPRLGMKKGGVVKSSASKRADGIALRGKTRGRMV